MRTDDLALMLANAAEPVPAHAVARRWAVAIVCGALGAVLLMLALLGVRPDIGSRAALPMFWGKLAFAACLAGGGLAALALISRPGVPLGRLPAVLAAPVLAMWLLAALSLTGAESGRQRLDLVLGQTWMSCPLLVAVHSVPMFVAVVWAMKGLAPTRLRLAGGVAGLASGAVGALAYALHCPELAAPFLAVWYVAGMLIPTALGALAGPRLLHW